MKPDQRFVLPGTSSRAPSRIQLNRGRNSSTINHPDHCRSLRRAMQFINRLIIDVIITSGSITALSGPRIAQSITRTMLMTMIRTQSCPRPILIPRGKTKLTKPPGEPADALE